MDDEVIRLILDVKGGAAAKDLRDNLANVEGQLDTLKSAYLAGEVGVTEYLKQGQKLARMQTELASTLQQVEEAIRQQEAAAVAAAQQAAEAKKAAAAEEIEAQLRAAEAFEQARQREAAATAEATARYLQSREAEREALEREQAAAAAALASEMRAEQAVATAAEQAAAAKQQKAAISERLAGSEYEVTKTAAERAAAATAAAAQEEVEARERAANTYKQLSVEQITVAKKVALEAERNSEIQQRNMQRETQEVRTALGQWVAAENTKARATQDATSAAQREATASIELGAAEHRVYDESVLEAVAIRDLINQVKLAETATGKLTATNAAAAAGAHRLAGATDKAAKGGANMGRSMLEGGRIVQDFYQGGMLGVLNNIEGMTMALGLGSGLAGALTILGVTASIVGPKLVDWGKSLVDGSNPVPEAKNRLEGLEDALKKNEKALDKLKEKTSLTNTELKEFNRLETENVALEKQKTKEMERQNDLKKLAGLKNETEEAQKKDQAETLQQVFGGQQDALEANIAKALNTENEKKRAASEQRIEELEQKANDSRDDNERIQLQNQMKKERKRLVAIPTAGARSGEARELLRRAMINGDVEAYYQIQAMMGQSPGSFTQEQQHGWDLASPEALGAPPKKKETKAEKRKREATEKAQKDAFENLDRSGALEKDIDKIVEETTEFGQRLGETPEQIQANIRLAIHDRLRKKLREQKIEDKGTVVDKEADEMAKEAIARSKKKQADSQKAALDEIKRSDTLDKDIDTASDDVKKKKLAPDQQFEAIKNAIVAMLKAKLKDAGVTADKASIETEARQMATEALNRSATKTKAAKTKEKTALNKSAAGEKTALDHAEKLVNETAIDELAAAQAATMRAQGGLIDARTGKVTKMTAEQQFQHLVQQLIPMLRRMFPKANQMQIGTLASRIASNATNRVEEAAGRASVNLAGQNLTNTQRLIAVNSQVVQQMQQQALVAQRQGQAIENLGRQVQQRSRTHAKRTN